MSDNLWSAIFSLIVYIRTKSQLYGENSFRIRERALYCCFGTYHVVKGVMPSYIGNVCICVFSMWWTVRRGRRWPLTPGDRPLALFDKCRGLFHVLTGTRDGRLNVPSEGQLVVHWCSVGRWIKCLIYHIYIKT